MAFDLRFASSILPEAHLDVHVLLVMLAPAIAALASSAGSRSRTPRQPELHALRMISSLINRSSDLYATLTACLAETLRVMKMEAGAIRLRPAPDEPLVAVHSGFNDAAIAALDSLRLEDRPNSDLPLEDLSVIEERADYGPLVMTDTLRGKGTHYFAVCPVRAGNRILGTLVLADRRWRRPSGAQEAFIATMADLLGSAVVSARLHEQADKHSDDLVALHEVNKIISQSLDLDDIIRRIVIEGKRLVKTRQCHLFLLDDRQQKLIGLASTQEQGLKIQDIAISLEEDSVAVRALVQGRVIAVENIPRLDPFNPGVMGNMRWRAAIFVPLRAKEQAIGVLIFSDESALRPFTQEEISRAETLAHRAAIALENARLFQVVSRSQKEWETTFDAMQDCVSVHDTTGKIIRANVALARRLKTTPPRMIGKSCSEIYHPAQLIFSACRHMETLHSENVVVEELELPAMGGTFQISVSPWYDKNNRLVGCIHVAKDVSNEKLLRQQLIQSEKLSAIGELISGIAHELNNPLTGVMGYSQLLQLRKDLDERARESLLKINSLALRCQKIVQNLLSFARKQKPERTLSNVNDMLERTIELRNYELSVNNIEIVRELDRSIPNTIADAHQLQQVFLNIITNAEHAMLQAHGRGRLTIRSRADLQENRIVVEIIDDGPGIQESHLSKIFDPFFTTKDVGKGTGLGLSLSYGIIKEHGGNIYARSRPGEGAQFVIELPIISKLDDTANIFPQLMPQALQFDNLVRNKRILIVDDEKYILDFFIEIFRTFPIQVDTAGDGRVAVEKLMKNDYDLIITDFKMPLMSGRELFQWIKQTRPALAKRIIFVTGDTVSAETRSFFETTCSRYLAKPFKIEEVKEAIQQALEGLDG
jgi:two-component system NtrC family sensor kinase